MDLSIDEEEDVAKFSASSTQASSKLKATQVLKSPESAAFTDTRKGTGDFFNGIKRSLDHNINHNKHFMSLSQQTKVQTTNYNPHSRSTFVDEAGPAALKQDQSPKIL